MARGLCSPSFTNYVGNLGLPSHSQESLGWQQTACVFLPPVTCSTQVAGGT